MQLVEKALAVLDWELIALHPSGVTARIPREDDMAGELLEVAVVYPWAFVSSVSQNRNAPNTDRNRQQVQRFLEVLERLETDSGFPHNEDSTEQAASEPLDHETPVSEVTLWRTFRPRSKFLVTPLLIFANLIVFIVMVASGADVLEPDTRILIDWGANYQKLTLDGEPWRLLTSCFLHIGVVHLLVNMYALLFVGILLEPLTGKARFATAYLLAGIGGSLNSVAWHSFSVSAGASGAIFGMYGMFLALLTSDLVDKSGRKSLLISMAIFVMYSLFSGMQGNTDNAAHIGGLVTGLLCGFAFIPSLRRRGKYVFKLATILLVVGIVGVTMQQIYERLPNHAAVYATSMQQFQNRETIALQAWQLPDSSSRAAQLKALKEKGIANWERNLRLLRGMETMDFPPSIEKRHELLAEYCELRIKAYELKYRAVSENSNAYDGRIAEYEASIQVITKELRGGEE